MQGSASLSLCARRQPKRWWVVQWKNSESTDILEVVFQVAQENENHLKRLHSNDSIDLLTYMMGVFGNTIIRHAGALPCYPVRFHTVGREASLFLGVIGRAHVVRCHRHLPWSAKAGACRAYSNGGLYA